LVLVVSNNAYRLDLPKETISITIKSKEARPKMLGGACCPSNGSGGGRREVKQGKVMVEYKRFGGKRIEKGEREAGWTNKYEGCHP
jgi:hypothetical protein